MSVSWWHTTLFCCTLVSTDIAGSSLAPVASRQRAWCSAWLCCVCFLSLRAGAVVSRVERTFPPMCEIRDMRACETAQLIPPCAAGRRHAEVLLDPTTDVHGSCADVTRISSPRRPTGRNRLSLRDVCRGLLLVPKRALCS